MAAHSSPGVGWVAHSIPYEVPAGMDGDEGSGLRAVSEPLGGQGPCLSTPSLTVVH